MFSSVNGYYKFHAKIYDLSRWAILFGKNSILDFLPINFEPNSILDLGCGTGYHLKSLNNRFPNASIIGVDASKEMLAKAAKKTSGIPNITLYNSSLENYLTSNMNFDLIICSYSITMFGDIPNSIKHIKKALLKGGYFLVVDFKSTPFSLFERWMNFNHVDISNLLFSEIEKHLIVEKQIAKSAYFGLWKYAKYLSRK